jgi:hypothetical protein
MGFPRHAIHRCVMTGLIRGWVTGQFDQNWDMTVQPAPDFDVYVDQSV